MQEKLRISNSNRLHFISTCYTFIVRYLTGRCLLNKEQMIDWIAAATGLAAHYIKNTIELLDSDNTVPFIARYRKEATGSMDEDQIRAVENHIRYLRNLEERKKTVLKSIEEQGKLTPELEEKIRAAMKLQDVEDLYLPYKPKRKTRASVARARGLGPLADIILAQEIIDGDPFEHAADFVNKEKEVETVEDALSGAMDIVAEAVSDDADIRKLIREKSLETGTLSSVALLDEAKRDYEMYVEFSEPVQSIPPYRILAMNRGERENMLRVWVDVDEEAMILAIEQQRITNEKCIFTDIYRKAIRDGYQRLIGPAIQREIRNMLTIRADEHAIEIFARNLRALLLTPPLRNKMILGIDPGFRTGCKVAVIDGTGKYLEGATIYPHAPQNRWTEALDILTGLIEKYKIDVIAVGNGTASRETEKLAAEAIQKTDRTLFYTIVNEAGASVYSASPVAKTEFPDLEASMRGNISIARRLLDPLSELVKIDPKSIGVGLYQHDVDQVKLSGALDQVVESCVNAVGVNLNTASASLLRYVAGINQKVAEEIVRHRENNGIFHSREQLKTIKGLGDSRFVQAAGFLRIPESDMFLDTTAVHPESYDAAGRLLNHLDLDTAQVMNNGNLVSQKIKEKKDTLAGLSLLCGCGEETLRDIIDSLEKPNRDPRDAMPEVVLRHDVLSMDDLREGMVLKGTVRNVVDFGAFVDIGVKHDGLVHLSQMAHRFVKNPLDVVSVGDVIDVRVLHVDAERGRIGLSMLLDKNNT